MTAWDITQALITAFNTTRTTALASQALAISSQAAADAAAEAVYSTPPNSNARIAAQTVAANLQTVALQDSYAAAQNWKAVYVAGAAVVASGGLP